MGYAAVDAAVRAEYYEPIVCLRVKMPQPPRVSYILIIIINFAFKRFHRQ